MKTLPFAHFSIASLCLCASGQPAADQRGDATHASGGFLLPGSGSVLPRIELIQIGEPVIPTVQLRIEPMAARPLSEIEPRKQAVLAEDAARRARTPQLARRTRCPRAR